MTRLEMEERYVLDMAEAIKSGGAECAHELARHLATTDLYYLLTNVLGRVDVRHDWLFDRCVEVQEDRDEFLDLWSGNTIKVQSFLLP